MKFSKLLAPCVYYHSVFALFAALLCFPASLFAESILLSASNFALLGGTAITSTGVAGTEIINGNVGLSPGDTSGITGFPPAIITNGAIIATGPVTLQARLDLIKASVGLNNMPSNANLSNVDLAGMTLAPGVYTFNGEAQLNGNLVLDAQGKNAVFWVFQIGTAFTSAINSTVTVINKGTNGGSDIGIFWNCGSAINIGGNNQMAGIYLSGTSITFGGNATGGGRALALAGISLDGNQFDAAGGPVGTDWSGGLTYDPLGNVVPVSRIIELSGNLTFGNLEINQTNSLAFIISNTGNSPMTISGINYPTGYSGDWSNGMIAAGATQTVNVTFSPTVEQLYGGTISVISDKTAGLNTIDTSGTGTPIPTRIILLTGNLDFGNVIINQTMTKVLTIDNNGNTAMTVVSISYPVGYSGNWSNGVIQPGNSQSVTITFSPTLVQSYNGSVTVNADNTHGTNNATMTGAGVPVPTRIIGVTGNLAFGNLQINQTATATMVINNSGNDALLVTSVVYPSGFTGNFNSGSIVAGGSQLVTVTFSPILAQSYSGTVTVNSDKTSGTNTIAASGTGTAVPTRIIGVSGTLGFGSLEVNKTATLTFAIANTGNTALAVTSVTYPAGFSGNFNNGSIVAGGSQTVTVTFSPTLAQSYSGTVTVNSDMTSGTNTIAASGTGTAIPTRIIGVSGSLSFGSLEVNKTATLTFAIANTGNTALAVTSVTYPAGFSGNFNNGSIVAGGSQTVTVTLSPTLAQSYSGTVTVNSDMTSGSNTIAASGTGKAVPTRIIGISGSLGFGSLEVNKTATQTFTINNTGNAALAVTSVTYPAGFTGNFNTGSIAAGGSQTVTVTFSPIAAQSYSGTVTMNSDKTSGSNTIAASGTGTAIPTRIIGVSGSLSFAALEVDKTATLTFTINNTGNTALAVTSVTYPAGFSGNFNTGSIVAGGNQIVTVTFSPTVAQSYSGTVTVNSDKTSGSNTIAASGTGTAIPTRIITLAGDLAFNDLEINTTAALTFTITNTGNTALAVTSVTYPVGFSGDFNSGSIAPSGNKIVTVTFSPIAAQSYSGTVTVNSDKTSGTNTLAASGTGSAVPTRIILLSAGLFFGDQTIDTTASQTFSISNTGNAVLTVTSVSYPTGFSGDWNSGTILAGGTQEVTVAFSPTLVQSYSGTVTITSDKTSGTATLSISGTGTLEPTAIIALSGSLDFGDVGLGHSVILSYSIGNSGNAPLQVNSIDYPAGFTGDWTLGSIAAGGSQTVLVTFSPVIDQSYGGNLTINTTKVLANNTLQVDGHGRTLFLGTATGENQLHRFGALSPYLWSEDIGFLYDGYWPFVYDYGAKQWFYVFCEDSDEQGYYFYNFNDDEFGYTGVASYPYYWLLNEAVTLKQFGQE